MNIVFPPYKRYKFYKDTPDAPTLLWLHHRRRRRRNVPRHKRVTVDHTGSLARGDAGRAKLLCKFERNQGHRVHVADWHPANPYVGIRYVPVVIILDASM